MKKFAQPIDVFEAPHSIENTDVEHGVFRYNATGISYRTTTPKVLADDGEAMAYLDRTYLTEDETVMQKLNTLAIAYWAMRDALQKQWEEVLEAAQPLTEDQS